MKQFLNFAGLILNQMKKLRQIILTIFVLLGLSLTAQTEYRLNDKPDGFSLGSRNTTTTTIVHNVSAVTLENANREGLEGQFITLSGIHIANQAGAPNLPSGSTFVAIPNGSVPSIRIASAKTKTIRDVDLIPAPQPQLDDDNSPAVYEKDMDIYGRNAYYPALPYRMSEPMTIRGIQMVEVGIMPFQYNPVSKELIVYENLELELTVEGGDGTYGDLRYRTPEWDQIISDMLLNREVLPEMDYGAKYRKHYENRETGCELMIITPDNEDFTQLADSIKQFRTKQGIPTKVFTVTQCGGNTCQAIRNFIRNAYNTWSMPPAAVLILGDHNNDGSKGVVSHTMENHPGGSGYNPYISDHAYTVMDNTHMPEIIIGRITGRDYDELYHMIKKDLDYERTPPTNPGFYNHPITAMGFQLERWFQLCSEIVNGFWEYELEKEPVRINAIYQGNPGNTWSTNENTNTIVNYFGPNGCGYIPSNMSHLTDWTGNGNKVNEAVNSGAFILQHRDHGAEEVWGEPGYNIAYINRLTNPDLTYVMSCNCLTGRFNYKGDNGCFAEAFHRHQYGALGLIAATQVSYSFVNDVYVWGAYDNMWPDFMPTYGTQHATNFLLPAFGNAAGKYFLRQSSWTDDGVKEITYYLFHQHGDPYMNLYSEVPQPLNVEMLPVLVAGSTEYQVKADEGTTICLTANGQIIGFDIGTGSTQNITITPQEVGTRVTLTIKKQNYYRYEHELATIPEGEPYLIFHSIEINDNEGNGNQKADYNETCHFNIGLHNVGSTGIEQVHAILSCEHPSVQVLQDEADYGTVETGGLAQVNDAFTVHFNDNIDDGEYIRFHLQIGNGAHAFADSVDLVLNAPVFRYSGVTLTDMDGNVVDRLMTEAPTLVSFDITNEGHSRSLEQSHTLNIKAPFFSVAENPISLPAIEVGATAQATFRVNANNDAPASGILEYTVQANSGYHTASFSQQLPMGYTTEDFDDGELNPSLGWELGSNNVFWYFYEDETAHGGHCLRSPELADKKKCNMFIALTCHHNPTFSFRHKTSTDNGDLLILYINNDEVASWSGETDWETSEYELRDGFNLIKITFKKDSEGSAGEDCVFIDDIILPPLEELVVFAGDDENICQTGTFSPNGYIYHHKDLLWSTNGDGSFNDPILETPIYTFGPNDLENRQVTLTLTGTSALNDLQDSSEVTLSFLENPSEITDIEPAVGDTVVDVRTMPQSEYHAVMEVSADFLWSLEPEQAGEIVSEGRQAIVRWDSNFKGMAYVSYRLSNDCGESNNSETLRVRVTNSTSVDENDATRLEVFPNPASDKIELIAHQLQGETVVIRIVDALGRTVYDTQRSTDAGILREALGTTMLRSGLYDLQIIDGTHIHSTRIIIKK